MSDSKKETVLSAPWFRLGAFSPSPSRQPAVAESPRKAAAELTRRGVGYKELAMKLAALGVAESEQNIANKLSRGGFSAVFLMQCLDAIECKTLRLGMD